MSWFDGNQRHQLIKERGYTMADAAVRFWPNSIQLNSAAKDVFNLSHLLFVDVFVSKNAMLLKFLYEEGPNSYILHHGTHGVLHICCSSFTSKQTESLQCWHDVDEAMDLEYAAIACFEKPFSLTGVSVSDKVLCCDDYEFYQIKKHQKIITHKPKARLCKGRIRFNKATLNIIDSFLFNENFYVFIEKNKVVMQFTPEWDQSTWTVTRDKKQSTGLFTCSQLMKIRNFKDGDFHIRKSEHSPNSIEILLDQPF